MTKKKKDIEKIIELLETEYKEVSCTLDYTTPLELLIATQLSAQCTDERVNIITKDLFEKFKSIDDYLKIDETELIKYIRPAGFFNNKAKNILSCIKNIKEEHGGVIPDNIEDLTNLPGVGRKTANVFLGEIHRVPGIIVDTHAKRLSNRIGLSRNNIPEKIEADLMKVIPKSKWTDFSHRLVAHGRKICKAAKPDCKSCIINNFCKYYSQINKG